MEKPRLAGALAGALWLRIVGGAEGIRTPYLRNANATFSRVNYGPKRTKHYNSVALIRTIAGACPEQRTRHRHTFDCEVLAVLRMWTAREVLKAPQVQNLAM